MTLKKFIRRDSGRFSKIGKNRKKLQKWRKPKGRDNKMRENRHGYPATVKLGYKTARKDSGKVDGKKVVVIRNVSDIENLSKSNVVILGRVGAKKKLDLIGRVQHKGNKILNVKSGGQE